MAFYTQRAHQPMSKASVEKLPIMDYRPNSTILSDLKVLRYMWFAKLGGTSHQEKLESFYKHQADLYDTYRHRMLHGRKPMIEAMPTPKGGVWMDMGGGTGSNLEYFGQNLKHFGKVVVLDLCPSLADQAKERVKRNGWEGLVDVVVADACNENSPGLPAKGSVDVVTFSYALSMIPDWEKAIQVAKGLLKPGGHICVCDFTVDDSQSSFMRMFWTRTFAMDHVHLKAEHRTCLREQFNPVHEQFGYGTFPYVPPVLRCPYYVFIGKKA